MSSSDEPQVFLVGAGPGDPGLLTLRAVECLGRADLVLYDKLVPRRLLDFAPRAEHVSVADLPGGHPLRWPHILQRVRDAATAGKVVVRLKGGDPLIFGRGSEEAEDLRAAGIAYEIVPGITAALAAAAAAEVPLTHRGDSSAVAFVTGHENPTRGEPAVDWAALARFPGTLVVYMGMARLELIARTLITHGKSASTPATVIASVATGDQRRVRAPLGELANAVRDAGLTAPALVVIGLATARAPEQSWLEQRSLFGRRILVTRPRRQAEDLARRLERLGAVPYLLPAVDVLPPVDWHEVDDRIARLDEYDWLAFTSVNGVEAFLNRLVAMGRDLRALGGIKLAAIGPATAAALADYRLTADIVPPSFRSESLAAELTEHVRGQRVLLARADRGREVLRDELSAVAHVDQVAVYRQVDAVPADAPAFDALRRGEIDVVTLTSANVARALLRALDETMRGRVADGHVKLATISPVTSAAVAEFGLPVAAEATEYTIPGLIDALVKMP
ncbi:MAG: uroporphyrinogen-III C-methyltransferase [Gemmataceae bacterium]